MNRLVAQAFQPAGLPDFRVRWTRKGRLESRPHPQARKPALRTRLGSWSQCAPNMTWGLPMNRCSLAQVANLLSRRLLIGETLERRTASGLATRDTAQRGGGANQVAASILPAVEPGFQPGGRNAPHTANRREFSSNCPSTPRFRAAGCRPLRQPGWLPLRNSRAPVMISTDIFYTQGLSATGACSGCIFREVLLYTSAVQTQGSQYVSRPHRPSVVASAGSA